MERKNVLDAFVNFELFSYVKSNLMEANNEEIEEQAILIFRETLLANSSLSNDEITEFINASEFKSLIYGYSPLNPNEDRLIAIKDKLKKVLSDPEYVQNILRSFTRTPTQDCKPGVQFSS